MKNIVASAFVACLPCFILEASEQQPYCMPGTQVIDIQDTGTGRLYELYVKLPETYSEESDTSYPVIYFTDAVWHIEALSACTSFLMEDVILVGISWQKDISEDLRKDVGAHASRFRDYTISKSSNPEIQTKYNLGQAGTHLDFIRTDVINHIESNYRTDPANRSYLGYSAGGLFGAYALLKHPDTFRNYILGSPSIQGDLPTLSELGSGAEGENNGLNANVYISYGTLEKELGGHVEEFINILKNRNDETLNLEHAVIEGEHQTAFPMTAVRSVTWLSNLTKAKE